MRIIRKESVVSKIKVRIEKDSNGNYWVFSNPTTKVVHSSYVEASKAANEMVRTLGGPDKAEVDATKA